MKHQIDGFDNTSLRLYAINMLFSVISSFTLNELATICTISAGVTTIGYNFIKMWKEINKK